MLNSEFVKPSYDAACFSNIPEAIRFFFSKQGDPPFLANAANYVSAQYNTVIFFLIDSFGWNFFERYYEEVPALHHIASNGTILKINSQFPSTTASHVTTIHTGLEVGQSGIFEWQYYEPMLDSIIAPLLFSFAGTKDRETLQAAQVDPYDLFPATTFYQDLLQLGVTSYIFQHQDYTPSTYSTAMFRGAHMIPYQTLPGALAGLNHVLKTQNSPSYLFLYYDTIDMICHHHGPNSPQMEAEFKKFFSILNEWFDQLCKASPEKTLFVMTADHGQIGADPEEAIYLNLNSKFFGIEDYIQKNSKGELLVPAGSCRDMHLYIKEDRLEEAHEFLGKRLEEKAEVYQIHELVENHLFGSLPVSSRFLSRAGNLVILPRNHNAVWWYEKEKFEQTSYGLHGGLSQEEMEIPLMLYQFDT
ncbi:MAG: alkaline phosphatase family protein [SAR324 cluster bacterium]|nr:alkaline phosphatase family protein [SAR324 cluster bacterium]